MLTITVPSLQLFDEETERFVNEPEVKLQLEHSLVSLSKWEAKFEKPFLSADEKSPEEIIGYIEAMTLTPNIPPEVFQRITPTLVNQVFNYIDAKMSATWFTERKRATASREIITTEIIYYWLIQFNIPFEAQHWHFNRLMTLIKVCNQKNAPDKQPKMNQRDLAAERRKINEQRKQKLNTTG